MGKAAAGAVLLVALWFVFTLVQIQWRLAVNQPLARELAEAVRARYPAATISGGASYQREVVYITVDGMAEQADQLELLDWLTAEKARRNIRPRVELRFYQANMRDETAFAF